MIAALAFGDFTWIGVIVALLAGGAACSLNKLLREQTGLGLKEAKDAVEAYMAGRGLS